MGNWTAKDQLELERRKVMGPERMPGVGKVRIEKRIQTVVIIIFWVSVLLAALTL